MNLNQSTEFLLTNYLLLPEEQQKLVIDFVHFLFIKYNETQLKEKSSAIELSEKQKETLVKRYEALQADPSRGVPWDIAKKELFSKYGI